MSLASEAFQASGVTYEDLADIEAEFDEMDMELLKTQARQEKPLHKRRAQLVRQIPNFWPLVLEQAPPEVDQYIQPTDAGVLLSALEDLKVTRFEVDADSEPSTSTHGGDPRSVSIQFTFAENDYFEDRTLEKKFWYRRTPKGKWSGLVSEPVPIKWKRGKDLTGGLLNLACQVWKEESDNTAKEKLQKELDRTSVGALSFFAWFGFVGRRIDAAASKAAMEEAKAKRIERQAERAKNGGKGGSGSKEEDDNNNDDDDDEDDEDDIEEYSPEIFPDGDSLAIMLAEDLWPNAIKYFRQAQEQDDAPSDDDFESDSDDDEKPPQKKQKN